MEESTSRAHWGRALLTVRIAVAAYFTKRRKERNKMNKAMSIIFVSLAFAGLATAAITPALVGAPTMEGVNSRWSYEISVDRLAHLIAAKNTPCRSAKLCGSYFTIYDFVGYVAGSATAPPGWEVQVALKGLTNATQAPTDSPSIVNLTFVYTGPPRSDKGPLAISGFTALSRYGAVNPDGTFTYQSEVDGFSGQAGVDAGVGSIEVPTAEVPITADRRSFAAPQGWPWRV
jgi:hypothetical protein